MSMSGSDSASGCGSGSASGSAESSGAESGFECAAVLGQRLCLPARLCRDPNLFREVISQRAWESLSEAALIHLRRFLPDFPADDDRRKDETVQRLFARENFHFGSPLTTFERHLVSGDFRPEVARLKRASRGLRARRAARRRRRQAVKSAPDLLAARERLLAVAHALPPPPPPPPPPSPTKNNNRTSALLDATVKYRYFEELASIRREILGESDGLSEDENYPEGPPPKLSKKQQSYRIQNGLPTIISTLGERPNLMNSVITYNDEWKRKALAIHRQRKTLHPNHSELNTAGITLGSVKSRTGYNFIKEEIHANSNGIQSTAKTHRNNSSKLRNTSQSLFTTSDSTSDEENIKPIIAALPSISVQSLNPNLPPSSPVTIKLENVPENTVIDEEAGLQLVQATHACFLSVIRDLVCSTPKHCLPLSALEGRVRNWRQNPIAPLNHWYSSVEDWVKALPSAVCFLTGDTTFQPEEYVPYLQYKPLTQVYQWIGAGRDSDTLLIPLCTIWLSQRQTAPAITPSTVRSPLLFLETVEGLGSQLNSKWNSRWQVSSEELEAFRTQEAVRFQRPHRAFTYHLPRGQVVVGPLKGVYGCDEPGAGTGRGARGHCLLTPTRPRHVTLLALVRDAVACLPGGEGTRAHITALLRRSQYLVPDAGEQALQAAVSGALDRMHGAPDPCVHYLPARKMWVYLHNERTEEEFERLHAETQVQSKIKATAGVQQKRNVSASKSKSRPVKPIVNKTTTPVEVVVKSNTVAEDEVDTEDVNVDVEGPDVSIVSTPVVNPSPVISTVVPITTQQTQIQDKVNVVSVMSGTSILQPRTPVLSTAQQIIKRNPNTIQSNSSRSMVRVLSSSTNSGKSLISPRALQPSTPPPTNVTNSRITTQTKVVVQRPAGQTTGALTPVQQRRLLESLMRHQRQHGQPMSHDQLLHTINSTQKMSSPSTITTTPVTKSVTPVTQTMQLTGQTVQLPSGQTVQLTGQTVQLTGQTVQLTGQTVQLGGQTVQIGGQTVQLAGQSVQLVGQTRPMNDASIRMQAQRQSTPLVAKILTGSPTTGLRLSGLSFGQLQGKPLLLQTSSPNKSPNILLQTSGSSVGSGTVNVTGGIDQKPTAPRPAVSTAQHTLLLSNIGGQMVRVAGSGALLGSTLRLQTPTNPVQGSSGVILSNALKLQTAPIRLHQGVANAGAGRVLLTGGARLHGLKLLPVHHSIARGGNVGGRQVYARIVNPTNAGGTVTVPPNSLAGNKASPSVSTTSTVLQNPSNLNR